MNTWLWIGIVQAVFLSLLLASKKDKKQPDYILLGWLLVIGLHLAYYELALRQFWRYRWIPGVIGHALAMCYGPLLYLYTLSLIRPRKVKASTFVLHFSPYILYVLLWMGFKVWFPAWNLHISSGLMAISAKVPFYIRSITYLIAISAAGYALHNLKILRVHQQNIVQTFSYDEKINLNWLRYCALSFFLIFICIFLILTLLPADTTSSSVKISGVSIVMLLWVFALGYFGFRQTHIFSNIVMAKPEQSPAKPLVPKEDVTTTTRYQKSSLKAETSRQYTQAAQQLMQQQKLYLNDELTLHQLAAQLNIPAYHLSQALNEQLQKNFFDFVNLYRVEEVKQKMADPKFQNYTLLAIAFESGFRSKASFNRVFKRFTGMTPSEYKKSNDL
ncbi:MAG TPA: hypothetical protein DCS93_21670 [Microscillaceae bacterium]|nr:hypothetical protein [Microscillaceae bacterium]